MVKQKILTKPKKSIRNGSKSPFKKKPILYDLKRDLLDEQLTAEAIWECLKDNDPEGVIEILETHFNAKNKSKLAKDANIPRTTIYHTFKSRNPTLQTLAKLIHAAA